jgi:mRNA-degrading endonuclease RelE of RelBE toxin-antitoxin system
MSFEIRYKKEFWDDYKIVIDWYNLITPVLSKQFFDAVEEAESRLVSNPFRYRIAIRDKFRRCLIRKFIYKIIYTIDGNSIIIFASFTHLAQINSSKRN